jgi:DNA-binding MarR family transcriptional regulator
VRTPLHVALIGSSSLHRKRSRDAFQAIGLSDGQPKVLAHLLREEGLLQRELATLCMVEPATMTVLLRKMAADELIWKESVRVQGKRAYRVYLTDKGRSQGKKAWQIVEKLEDDSFRGFSEEEKDQLVSLLLRVFENLRDMK